MLQPVSSPHDPSPASASGGLPRGVGLLVVGHGTADAVGASETQRVAQLVAAARPEVPVSLGFLEVIGPTIEDGLAELAAAGCREVVAAPLLLFAAGHAKRDVPEAISAAAAVHGMRVVQADPLGCHAAITELSRRRRREAEAGRPAAATGIVFIGRGSSDPTALPQLREFAALSLAGEPPPRTLGFGFVAAARPTLCAALDSAADPPRDGLRRILVQPHILFRGHVEEQVTAAVLDAKERYPELEWVQVARLGPDRLVAQALAERAVAACQTEKDAAGRLKMARQTPDESSE
jgi:sirohydrochlorin cobaltochelatase